MRFFYYQANLVKNNTISELRNKTQMLLLINYHVVVNWIQAKFSQMQRACGLYKSINIQSKRVGFARLKNEVWFRAFLQFLIAICFKKN